MLARLPYFYENSVINHLRYPCTNAAAVAKVPALRLEIVKWTDDVNGFVVLPRRWVIERTFSWFGRNHRLAKDFENLACTLAAFVAVACIQIGLRRLARI